MQLDQPQRNLQLFPRQGVCHGGQIILSASSFYLIDGLLTLLGTPQAGQRKKLKRLSPAILAEFWMWIDKLTNLFGPFFFSLLHLFLPQECMSIASFVSFFTNLHPPHPKNLQVHQKNKPSLGIQKGSFIFFRLLLKDFQFSDDGYTSPISQLIRLLTWENISWRAMAWRKMPPELDVLGEPKSN